MAIPTGYATVNPFIISHDLAGLLQFITEVFDAVEHPWVRTVDGDGLLLHAELQIGDSTIMFGERKPDWNYMPALIQVYVPDVQAALDRAEARGAQIITRATPFFGATLSRILDPWGNVWWVYNIPEGDATDQEWGEGGGDAEEWSESADSEGVDTGWEHSPELDYIHRTLLEVMPRLTDPLQK